MSSGKQLELFLRYAEALGAERYRVTSIKMREDGTKENIIILDKKGGTTRGWTAEQIPLHISEMQRFQAKGENLYYTPLSDTKHHIVIDDMNPEKLERLIRDGYKPAAVIESSHNNYQAILTVPKLGTEHDREVGNRICKVLNEEYGDRNLLGAVHPHRAPGFQNRKPKHQREDGSYPEVRLLKAERRECVKALELSRQIDAEYQQQAALKAQQPVEMGEDKGRPAQEPVTASVGAAAAYQRHYCDVLKRQRGGRGGNVDLSRVDAMVAVRLRVTGHSQADIEGAIRECAPGIRQKDEGRDWNDYAQRTARYAYSSAGDMQVEKLARYRRQWMRLERAQDRPK